MSKINSTLFLPEMYVVNPLASTDDESLTFTACLAHHYRISCTDTHTLVLSLSCPLTSFHSSSLSLTHAHTHAHFACLSRACVRSFPLSFFLSLSLSVSDILALSLSPSLSLSSCVSFFLSFSIFSSSASWTFVLCLFLSLDDDCFYHHSWRNNAVIAFGTLSSLFT